ncbi:MAG: alpha/beta hydrolase [Pseudomonadota bacterium]
MKPLIIDPALFRPEAVSEETRRFNEIARIQLAQAPDPWAVTPAQARKARAEGKGFFPLEKAEPTAKTLTINGPAGPLELRHFTPKGGGGGGTFLHFHGGGWQVGAANAHDVRLQEMADRTGLHVLSVEYRLAPEHPYPAAPDDCEAAALWLVGEASGFHAPYFLGGESAGAHLATCTLLRLRDRHDLSPFTAAILTAGVYDLGLTASAKNWGAEKLVLNSRDMLMFTRGFLQNGEDRRNGHVSPLYANLHGLSPALFSVGTEDLLLDDTLMMATRWHAANGNAQLDITPGGCHVFQSLRNLKIAQDSNQRIDDYLTNQLG